MAQIRPPLGIYLRCTPEYDALPPAGGRILLRNHSGRTPAPGNASGQKAKETQTYLSLID